MQHREETWHKWL